MYFPIVSVVSVVYDRLFALLIGVQLLPEPLSQEYINVPPPVVARHVRVVVALIGMVASDGCSDIDGGPVKYYVPINMLIGVVTPRAVCRSAHSQGASPLQWILYMCLHANIVFS